MAKQKHTLMEVLGLGAAAFAAYKFVYEPWHENQLLTAATANGSATTTYPSYTDTGSPSILSSITSPTPVTAGITPSNLDPGARIGGEVGACMHKKDLTQADCTARLAKIRAAWNDAKTQLAALQGGTAAAAAQAALTANQAAAATDLQNITAAKQRGDAGSVLAYTQAYNEHSANAKASAAALAAIPSRITAYQAAIVGYVQNYANYTGLQLA